MTTTHYPDAFCTAIGFTPVRMALAGLLHSLIVIQALPIPQPWSYLFVAMWLVDYVAWIWHRSTCCHCYVCRCRYTPSADAAEAAANLHTALVWLHRIIWTALIGGLVVTALTLFGWTNLELHAALNLVWLEAIPLYLLAWNRHWRWKCPICYPDPDPNWSLPPLGEPSDAKH